MKPRYIFTLIGLVVMVLGYVAKNALTAQKEKPEVQIVKAVPLVVRTFAVKNKTEIAYIPVNGKLTAKDRIDVYSEVSGIVLRGSKKFEEGIRFSKGEVLVHLDDREAAQSLLSQKSAFITLIARQLPDIKIDFPDSFASWEKYLDQLNVKKPLPDLPEASSEKEKLFIASREISTQFYQIRSAEIRLSKYAITAPFDGVVSMPTFDAGTLVQPGQKLGEFFNHNTFELEVAINPSDMDFVGVGDTARLTSEDISGEWLGRISRISNRIDPNTQTVSAFIDVNDPALREGMYLRGSITGKGSDNLFRIDRKLLEGEKFVWGIKESKLIKVPVQIWKKGENTAVLSGIPDGTVLIADRIPDARTGMEVQTASEAVGK